MRHFLDAYWQRGDRQSDEIAMLLGDLNSQMTLDGSPADPAQWSDWLEAVEKAEADFKGLAD